MSVRNGAVTPGPSRECDITFFAKRRPKSARQSRDSTVVAHRVQSVTVPSSRVSRECRSPGLRCPPLRHARCYGLFSTPNPLDIRTLVEEEKSLVRQPRANSFLGAQDGGFEWWAKVCLEKVYVLFLSLREARQVEEDFSNHPDSDLFSRVLFSFLPLLPATPLPPLFSAHFRHFFPSKSALFCRARGHSAELGEGQLRDAPLHRFREGNSFPKSVEKKGQFSVLREARQVEDLVAQSSATGVTVAAIPPCSAIRFGNPKVPRYPPPARRDTPPPCLLRVRQESATEGSGERCDTLIWGGVARFWRDTSDSAGI